MMANPMRRSLIYPPDSLRQPSAGAAQCGFSLVELMVALTVGLVLLAGLVTIFVNNSSARDEIERANQQVENGRYAMEVITDDLSNAGYYAEFDPTSLVAPSALPNVCAISATDLKTSIPLHVQGVDNAASVPTCISDVRAGSDILVIRRVGTCVAGSANCDALVAGRPYFQASLCSSSAELASTNVHNYYGLDTTPANLVLHKRDCATIADLHRFVTHIYYVANNDNAGDAIPTLKLAELSSGGFTPTPLVQGIGDMQLEYGLDTSGDGVPDVFTTDPNSYNGCSATTTPTCVGNWQNAVAVKIHILSRAITQSPGFSDTKTYTLGLKFDNTSNTVGPFNDRYKRHAYVSSVKLYNAAGRRNG